MYKIFLMHTIHMVCQKLYMQWYKAIQEVGSNNHTITSEILLQLLFYIFQIII